MSVENSLDWYDSIEDDLGYRIEDNKNAFAILLNTLMMEQGINKAELAKRIRKSAPYVTKVLRGDTNLTISSMTALLDAINCELHIKGCRKGDGMKWVGVIAGGQTTALNKPAEESSTIWAKQASYGKKAA